MNPSLDISIIVPVYNEVESLPELALWIERVLQNKFTYEVIMIDDGSQDGSWDQIVSLSEIHSFVKGIRFNRNYGKSAALNEGFIASKGKVVITMDADLQDSPDEVPELFRMITEDRFDLVSGWKKKRHDPIGKTIPSKLFNYVTRKISGIPLHDFNCGLKAYKSDVIKNIEVYGEMHRYIPYIAKWHGYHRIGEKVVEHRARKFGVSKFGLERFVNGFLDLLSITFVSRFKKKPMHFFGTFGMVTLLIGFFITAWLIGEKIYHSFYRLPVRDVVDQPLFFLALMAIVIGVQLFLAGFLAEMMIQVSPKKSDYLVAEKVNVE